MELSKEELQKLLTEKNRLSAQITMSIEVITPDLAREYLSRNLGNSKIKNRAISLRTVIQYYNDMTNGRWKVGPPIMFDVDKNMIDGQTRCTAVVRSNKPIISVVLRGIDNNVFDAFDCGKKRTHKDALTSLKCDGKSLDNYASSVSGAINLMFSIAKNHTAIDKNRTALTNTEIVEIVKGDFDYYSTPFTSGKITKWRENINKAISQSILAAFYYINKKTHGTVVDEFLSVITSNDANTPAVVRKFRDMVIENKGKKSDERGYLPPVVIFRLIDTLFKYNLEKNGFTKRKHFSKIDLQAIYE
jgi:hypothetical protein